MATNKSTILRYKHLDKLLANRNNYYNVKELLEKCNEQLETEGYDKVTRRTIEKDLEESLPSLFGADIETYKIDGRCCKRYKDPTFSIFTEKLTEQETNLLSEVLNTLGQFDCLSNFNWIEDLKQRLEVKHHCKIISFDNNPYLKNSNLLGELFDKISNKSAIKLQYRKFSSAEVKEYILHPYLLKQYNNRWFLIAGTEDNKIGNYALDRIEGIISLPEIRYRECDVDLEERFEDIVGVTVPQGKNIEKILLWVTDDCFPYIDTKPLHSSQCVIKDDREIRQKYHQLNNGKFIRLECRINYELKQLLLSYIKDVIILTPQKLQGEIFDIIKEKNEQYFSITN